ncbi:hypothetical protein [Chryseobacterium sp. KCF3-3]|uniref:hypothetical protein n=1 Tax=Chryseobacterium sp. KCF3-3 TaxID=3231511 RepID=UPI0038B2F18F
MKKQTLFLLGVSMMLTLTVKAQVGVNNTSPKATLDITAKTTDGTAPEGFIGPRLTGDQIKAADAQYTAVHTGMMIYATAAVTTASAKTVNMTAPGYYVFDGTVWNKVGTSVQNIYTADGTLTGNRTVSQAANDLAFTSTATTGTSHFTVDGNTLNVDAVNSRVGIGTNVPLVRLDVAGAILNRGGATVDRQGTQLVWNDANLGGSGLGYSGILNHRGTGIGGFVFSGTADNTTFAEYMRILGNGNVGIGTTSPAAKLEVSSGTANVSGLKFSNFNSSTPIGTGQTIGVDASGNVITMANASATTVTTTEYASTTGAIFNVNDLGYTIVTGTPQNITIPAGGKALFINFMMGIDYSNPPAAGSNFAYYQATLFIDGVATNVYQTTQEGSVGGQAQFNFSTVKFLTAGAHTIDARMIRSANNGTTAGANMPCRPISVSFNASYLN